MCIKIGDDEFDTVRNLMRMSLLALISETLEVDIDALDESQPLAPLLARNGAFGSELAELIADYFDGLRVEPSDYSTLGELFSAVIEADAPDTLPH